MLSRRIVASACALCLALPAAATAKDVRYVGHVHHSVQAVAVVAAGDTKSDLPGTVTATLPGDTKSDLPGAIAPTPASHNTAVAPQADRAAAGAVRRRHGRLAAGGRDRGRCPRGPRARGRPVDDGPPAPRSPHGGVEERTVGGGAASRPRPHSVCVRNGRRPRAR